MRNLKKVLSLVLCMAMMLSIMVVGAGAAFKDQEKIVNTEAVDMCSALNIINGYEDGSFKPEGTITRAEACKMICVALNGGKDPVLGTNATASFTDIKGHWAEGYIEYCYAEGIVAGVGGGKFDPAGNVTGSQFAKMLLTALGFKADQEKFTGASWEVNVNVKASAKNLYEDLETMDPSVALTRDNAAQMLWNALNAEMVEYDYKLSTVNGTLTSELVVKDIKDQTLLGKKYNTANTDGTTGILTKISYSTTKDEYTYTIQKLGTKNTLGAEQKYVTEVDYTDLLGHNVTFVVKANADKTVYGAYANDSVELVSGLMGDISYDDYAKDATIEVNGVDYDVDSLVTGIEYGADKHATDWTQLTEDEVEAAAPYYEFSAIDWDDDDDIDLVIVYPVDFGKITYVSSDYVRVAVVNEGKENVNMATPEVTSTTLDTKNAEDYTLYEGAAKDDYALISADTSLKTLGTITELAKETGKVTSTSKDTAVIGGASYDISWQTALKNARNTTVDFRTINNYVVWSDATNSVDVSDYVLVTGITGSTASSGYYKADLLFSDGTTATADIKSIDTNGDGQADMSKNNASIPGAAAAGTLWEYEISSGRYELTALPATNLQNGAEGFDLWLKNTSDDATCWQAATKASDADAKVVFDDNNKAKFDSSAVVFVRDGDDFSVKTGADLAKVTGTATVLYAGAEENDNGYNYVTFAYVETGSVSASGEIYGFITSDITVTENSDGTFYSFTAWNGTEYADLTTVDVKSNDFTGTGLGESADIEDGTADLAKQAIISYKLNADGAVTDLEVLTETVGALTAYDGDDIMVSGRAYTTDKDTTFLYIDRDGKKGETSGVYSVADKVDSGLEEEDIPEEAVQIGDVYYYANVMVYRVGESGDLDLVVVDVTNDWFAVNQ